jgi:Cft2 family RNA processing exonuclease
LDFTQFHKDHIGQGELEMETREKFLVVDYNNNTLRIVLSKMLSLREYLRMTEAGRDTTSEESEDISRRLDSLETELNRFR